MHFFSIVSIAVAITGVAATPFKFPTPDGFPKVGPATFAKIERIAGGSLPNGQLPTSYKPAAIAALQLTSHNELFETAFFSSLLTNITSNVPGYRAHDIAPLDRAQVIKAIEAIVAQEKVHFIAINALLTGGGQAPIAPCAYTFPVCNFRSAIRLAQTFTDIALGTLPAIQVAFALDGGQELGLVQIFSSVLGQEAEQVGFFRYAQKKVPSAAPQLTGGDANFAFTVLNQFIVPGSCPVPFDSIPLKLFGKLDVPVQPPAHNSTLKFVAGGRVTEGGNSLVYISGQNTPLTVPIAHTAWDGKATTFEADFPFDLGFARGLTLAVVVNGVDGVYQTYADVAAATLYGPGNIEVDY